MKYFTDDIMKISIFDEDEETEGKWLSANKEYHASLDLLRNRVSKSVWRIAKENIFHDARFIRFDIEEGNSKIHPTVIKLLYLKKGKNLLFVYNKVRCFRASFNEQHGIDYLGIHDCIYSELLSVDNKTLSHELSFSSGARFYFEFEKVFLKR